MELLKRVAAGLPSTEHLQFEAQTVGSPSETSIVWPVHHTFARAGDKALYQIRFGPAHNVWMRDGRLARKYIKQWKQYTEDAIDTANGQGILQALKEADHGFAGRFRMLPMLSADVSAIRDQEIKTRYEDTAVQWSRYSRMRIDRRGLKSSG